MANHRSYTEDQVRQVRQLHSQGLNDGQIARELRLSVTVVHSLRKHQLGLPAHRRWPTIHSDNRLHPFREEILRMHALNYSDSDIARRIGRSRRGVTEYRRRHLHLPAVDPQQRVGREIGRRKQDRTLGQSLGQRRAESIWGYAPSLGWPTGIRYRAVQILELLFQHEALTRPQIPQLLGVSPSVALKSNDPQGTYLGNLIARGLVAAAGKVCDPRTPAEIAARTRARNINLYFLTPVAREMKQTWLARRDGLAEPCSPLTEERLS